VHICVLCGCVECGRYMAVCVLCVGVLRYVFGGCVCCDGWFNDCSGMFLV